MKRTGIGWRGWTGWKVCDRCGCKYRKPWLFCRQCGRLMAEPPQAGSDQPEVFEHA